MFAKQEAFISQHSPDMHQGRAQHLDTLMQIAYRYPPFNPALIPKSKVNKLHLLCDYCPSQSIGSVNVPKKCELVSNFHMIIDGVPMSDGGI